MDRFKNSEVCSRPEIRYFQTIPGDSQDYENAFIVGNYPAAWREHYDRAGYARVDPTVSHPERTADFLGTVHLPDAKAARVLRGSLGRRPGVWADHAAAWCSRRTRALSLSVEGKTGPRPTVSWSRSCRPCGCSDYALQSGAGLAFEHPVSKPVVLTSREKEVLQWCAIGKTSWEISVICNCSEANVNFHGNIRRKFGVTSRRVAAIMAVNLGLITL